jgi:xanthine dehydrogenase YagR molybdenum-binding subunit
MHLGDTDVGLVSPTSAGSATVATLGPAIVNAADDLLASLRGLPGADGEKATDLEALSAQLEDAFIEGTGECPEDPDDVSIRTFGAQSAEVEVDMRTGEITVVSLAVAADCGTVINPMLARSQVIGGALQGLGYALTEERVVDEQLGLVLNANLEEYHIPTAADVPNIDYRGIDRPDRHAAVPHAKGIGEPPLIPTSAAIANAVFDATGFRMTGLPLDRKRMIARIREQAENS